MLFAVLPRDHDSYTTDYKPKLFSVCINVKKSDLDTYVMERCPMDDCDPKLEENTS